MIQSRVTSSALPVSLRFPPRTSASSKRNQESESAESLVENRPSGCIRIVHVKDVLGRIQPDHLISPPIPVNRVLTVRSRSGAYNRPTSFQVLR